MVSGWGAYNVSHDRRTGTDTQVNGDVIITPRGNRLQLVKPLAAEAKSSWLYRPTISLRWSAVR